MADNVTTAAGTFASDDIGGVQYQRVKISQGADGSGTDVSSAAPLNITRPISTGATTSVPGTQPTTTAAQLVPAFTVFALIVNNGSQTVYIGPSGVTTSTGFPLAPGGSYREELCGDAIYGITASGTADIRRKYI